MKGIKSLINIVRKLNDLLTPNQRKMQVVIIVMIVLGSLTETLGISAILPFIQAIMYPEQLLANAYVQQIVNYLHIESINTLIILIGIGIIVIYAIKNIYLYMSIVISTIFRTKVHKYLSTKLMSAFLKRNYETYVNLNTAEVMRSIDIDILGVSNVMDNLYRFIGELITAVFIGTLIITTDPMMAICIIGIAGLCFAIIVIGVRKKTKELGIRRSETLTTKNNHAMQVIMGFKEIKVSNTAEYFAKKYNDYYELDRVVEVKNEAINNMPEKLIEAVCVGALIGIICVKIAMGTDMTTFIPKIAIFAVGAFRLLPSVSRMTRYMNGIIYNNAFLNNMCNNIAAIPKEYEDNQQNIDVSQIKKLEFSDRIQINHVEWQYANSDKKVLDGITFEIKKGESIGLVGASGAGKTTMADVILGLLKPQKGHIMCDNQDIFEVLPQWSKTISYVPQNIFLINGTIRENISFGVDREKVDDARVWDALRMAQLEEMVQKLPEQLDTVVGERGMKFSGGQRQRIAIARALYHDADVIVLDEATSALDTETENAVMESIEALQGYKTLIIVAHRLSTLEHCDKIYEIVNGVACERSWNALQNN